MKLLAILTILTLVSTLTTVSTVSAQNMTLHTGVTGNITGACIDNGNIPPCLGDNGELVVYCDDPAFVNNTTCMPSAQDWAKILPSCRSVNYDQSCSLSFGGQKGPLFTCNDPEFNVKKYPQGCINTNTNTNDNQNNNNNNDNKKSNNNGNIKKTSDGKWTYEKCINKYGNATTDICEREFNKGLFSDDYKKSNSNNKDGKITVGYGDVGSYYGKGKVVIKNLDTGETLVTQDLNFAKQHNNQGNDCCVKIYTFDKSRTHNGDSISAKVTGGGGSWESGTYNYKDNLRMSITLDEIGDHESNNGSNDNNNNNDNQKDITKGADFVCDVNKDYCVDKNGKKFYPKDSDNEVTQNATMVMSPSLS